MLDNTLAHRQSEKSFRSSSPLRKRRQLKHIPLHNGKILIEWKDFLVVRDHSEKPTSLRKNHDLDRLSLLTLAYTNPGGEVKLKGIAAPF